MGWFSRKPQGHAFPFAVSLVHAASDVASAWWPKFGISDAPERIAQLGELQVYGLAYGSAMRAMVSIPDSAAREVISSTQIVLQTLVLRRRPEDFSIPQRRALAEELNSSIMPVIEEVCRTDPTFARAVNGPVFSVNSVDSLLTTANAYGAWIGRSGDRALLGIGEFFRENNEGFGTPLTDLAAKGLIVHMIEKAGAMATSYRW